jgi:hypothetical protein
MNEPPLSMGGPGSPKITDVLIECVPGPPPTMWRITVNVDFVPVHGFFKAFMPVSPVSSSKVRYTARLTSN